MKSRLPIMGTNITITRPILIKVLQDIGRAIGCDSNPYIYVDGNSKLLKGRNRNRGTVKNNRTADINKIIGNQKEWLVVTDFQDVIMDTYELDLQYLHLDSNPIFLDKEVGVYIKPVMQKRKVTISIQYGNLDLTYINSVVNTLNMMATYPGNVLYHNLEYSYNVPSIPIFLLYSVWKNKMKYTSEDKRIRFQDYVIAVGDDRLTSMIPDTGNIKDMTCAIREVQQSVVGYFTEDLVNLKVEEDEKGGGSIDFEYTFSYDEVTSLEMKYPCLVYNTPLPKGFYNGKNRRTAKEISGHYGPRSNGIGYYGDRGWKLENSPYLQNDYIKIPVYDENMKINQFGSYGRMLVSLLVIDPENKKSLLNIKDFDKFELKGVLMDAILGSEREYVTKYQRSFIWFALIEDGNVLVRHPLTLLENGDLVSDVDLDMKKTYRLGVYLLTDYNALSNEDYTRFSKCVSENLRVVNGFVYAELEKQGLNVKELNLTDRSVYMSVMKVKNQYGTLIETLGDMYGLKPEEKDKIIHTHQDQVGMFFKIMKRDYNSIKYVQIYKTVLSNALDLKEEKDGTV